MEAHRNPSPRRTTPADGCPSRRLTNDEAGWTLVELLIVVLLLGVVLTAILSIADGTQKTASADNERTNAIGEAQVGIARIADDLRHACVIFGASGSGSTGYYCRQNFTAAPATTVCTRSSDCVDMIVDARTAVSRPAGTATRALLRIRIDCGAADPASGSQTQCARYAVGCTPAACPSPTALTGVLARSITNGGAAGSPSNVFVYCTRDTISSAAGAPACAANPAAAGAVQVSLAIARKGSRVAGGPGAFLLSEGAELKNMNRDAS